MAQDRPCRECGLPLPEDAPGGACPVCSLQTALKFPPCPAPQKEPVVSEPGHLPTPKQETLPRFGDYELIELIARGGMGVVYRARQTSLNRTVALKMIQGGALAGAAELKRFHAEAEAIAHLQHPYIVAIHEVGEHQGQHFFSMDYVAGRTLAELARDGPLPATRGATYVKMIAEAIHYAHEHGIIHRDLKPANVILDDQDQPHITDFGLAKRLSDSQASTRNPQITLSGQVLGSPNYLPPEQADPKRGAPGPASDVYALGAILYHLVTGRPPFQAESLTTLLRQVVETDPVTPRSLNPSISRDLETVCLKCLAKDPSHRYATARALADDLARFLNHEPVLARPVGSGEKAWRWCRRQPVRAGLIGALALALVLGLAGISWQWRRAEQERRTAQENEQLALRQAYAGDMKLVQRSLEEGDLKRARDFLERYRPKSKSSKQQAPDLRGWEWRYLWGLSRSDANYTLTEGSNTFVNLALAPGGRLLAVRQQPGNIELWDMVKRQYLGTLTNNGTPLAMSFSSDGRLLASGNYGARREQVVSFWDVTTQQIVTNFPPGSNLVSLALSPDGKRLATFHVGENARVRLWDMPSGNLLMEISSPGLLSGTQPIPLFSPDGTILALGDSRGQIQLLDLETGLAKTTIPSPKEGEGVWALAFSPNGRLLASGYGMTDSTIRLWDARTGEPRGSLEGHQGFVEKLVFSPDGQRLYSASFDQSIRIWDVARRQQIRRLQGHTWRVSGLALCPGGHSLVSCAFDGSVRVWDLRAEPHFRAEETLPILVGNYGALFAQDSRRVITASLTNPVTIWDAVTGEAKTIPGLGTNNQSVALSPDQRLLAVGARDGTLELWDLDKHCLLLTWKAHQWPIMKLCFLDAGKSVVSIAMNMGFQTELKRWETASGRETPLRSVAVEGCRGIAVSPDEQHLALTYGTAATKVWDRASGRLEATLGSEMACFTPVFSRDGRLIAAALRQRARVWEVGSWRQIAVIELPADNTYAVTFSPDGERLVVGSWVRQESHPALRVWDYVVERELLSLYNSGPYTGWIEFSPDGNTLLGVSWSGVAKVWRAPSWAEIEAAEKEMP